MNEKGIGAWIRENGALKAASRLILIVGVVVALVLTGFGFVDMLKARSVDEYEATQKKIVSEQKKEAKKLKAAAEKEAKANAAPGEEIPKIEIDYTTIEVNVPAVKKPLEDYFPGFITGYLGWIFISLVSGVALSTFVGNLKDMYLSLKKAGPYRILAGVAFWVGVIIAAVIACFGIAHILEMEKCIFQEVLMTLVKNYLVWSLLAVVVGFVVKRVILMISYTIPAQN